MTAKDQVDRVLRKKFTAALSKRLIFTESNVPEDSGMVYCWTAMLFGVYANIGFTKRDLEQASSPEVIEALLDIEVERVLWSMEEHITRAFEENREAAK